MRVQSNHGGNRPFKVCIFLLGFHAFRYHISRGYDQFTRFHELLPAIKEGSYRTNCQSAKVYDHLATMGVLFAILRGFPVDHAL